MGFALDRFGAAFKTVNGGKSWSILDTGTSNKPRAILAPSAGRVLLVARKGLLLSTDGGDSFQAVRSKAVKKRALLDLDLAGSALLTFGRNTLAVSKNGGASWQRLSLPEDKQVRRADFLSGNKGYVLTTTGTLVKTSNGDAWNGLPGIGTEQGTGISFSSPRSGYMTTTVFGSSIFGYALRTTDGGKTWQPQLIAPESVDVWDAGSTGFAVGETGMFFATTSGGQAGSPSKLKLDEVKRSRSSAAKSKRVKVTGKLSPAEGGEQIVVSFRKASSANWRSQTLTAASNGRFTTRFEVKGRSFVVAQWSGDDERAGAGSKALELKP